MSVATAQSTTEIPPSSTDLPCSVAPCADSAAIAQVRLEDILSDLSELESSIFGVEVEIEKWCQPWLNEGERRPGSEFWRGNFKTEGLEQTYRYAFEPWTLSITCIVINGFISLKNIAWTHREVGTSCATPCGEFVPALVKEQFFETALESSGIVTRPSESGDGAEQLGKYKFVIPSRYEERSLIQPQQANWVECESGSCPRCINTSPLYKRTNKTFSVETLLKAKEALSTATKEVARQFSEEFLNSLVAVPVCIETSYHEDIDRNNLCQSQDVIQTEDSTSYSYKSSIDFPESLLSLAHQGSEQKKQFEACQPDGKTFPETEVNLVLYPHATVPTTLHLVEFFWEED